MRCYRYFLLVVIFVTAVPSVQSKELNNGTITCSQFLASGQANMAALISWLRGYHGVKQGLFLTNPPTPTAEGWVYCKQHPDANLIDASEQILNALDQGI